LSDPTFSRFLQCRCVTDRQTHDEHNYRASIVAWVTRSSAATDGPHDTLC